MAAAQARRKGLMRRAGDMRYSLLQCCHADAPLGRTQRGDGGQSPPLPGRVCRLAFGVRELPLSGAVAASGPSRPGSCSPHVRRRGRAAQRRRTYARTRVKIQTWFSNSVVVADSHRMTAIRFLGWTGDYADGVRSRSGSGCRADRMRPLPGVAGTSGVLLVRSALVCQEKESAGAVKAPRSSRPAETGMLCTVRRPGVESREFRR